MLMTERLKAARKQCKLTQQQVADLLGVDRSTYAYYELGVSNPSYENLVNLASIFKTDIGWLLGADRVAGVWNAPENEFTLLRAVKEKQMADLSKEERQIIALYRMAGASGKTKEFFELLRNAAGKTEDEE